MSLEGRVCIKVWVDGLEYLCLNRSRRKVGSRIVKVTMPQEMVGCRYGIEALSQFKKASLVVQCI